MKQVKVGGPTLGNMVRVTTQRSNHVSSGKIGLHFHAATTYDTLCSSSGYSSETVSACKSFHEQLDSVGSDHSSSYSEDDSEFMCTGIWSAQ